MGNAKNSQAKIENEINKMLDGDHQTIYELKVLSSHEIY